MKKKAKIDEVIKNLNRTDGTGDPEWVEGLVARAAPYYEWELGYLPTKEIENHTSTTDESIEEYAEDYEKLPAIVVVPSEDRKYKWEILDGGHRAAAAEMVGRPVLAYYPKIKGTKSR